VVARGGTRVSRYPKGKRREVDPASDPDPGCLGAAKNIFASPWQSLHLEKLRRSRSADVALVRKSDYPPPLVEARADRRRIGVRSLINSPARPGSPPIARTNNYGNSVAPRSLRSDQRGHRPHDQAPIKAYDGEKVRVRLPGMIVDGRYRDTAIDIDEVVAGVMARITKSRQGESHRLLRRRAGEWRVKVRVGPAIRFAAQ
jgi:hypothetical protein